MELPVNIAGHVMPWSFAQMSQLAAWLKSVPWLEQGGVRVIRLSDQVLLPGFADIVKTSARGFDSSNWVRIVEYLDDKGSTLSSAMTEMVCGTATELDARQLRDRVASTLLESPHLFLISSQSTTARKMIDDALDLEDYLSKSDARYPLVILFFAFASESTVLRDDFDLTVGFPVESTLQGLSLPESEVWGRYLHARIAWETGGDAAEARRIFGPEAGSIARLDDDGLERILNSYSAARAASVSGEDASAFEVYVEAKAAIGRRITTEMKLAEGRLIKKGLLWRRPGDNFPVTVPWFARHLLLTQCRPEFVTLLRHAIVCAPLAREILAICFDIEAQERSLYWKTRQATPAKAEILESCEQKFREFGNKLPRSPAVFYPSACPGQPREAWHCASFGEFFNGFGTDSRTPSRQQVVNIRNSLSHGHYVSWRLLSAVLKSRQQLLSGVIAR